MPAKWRQKYALFTAPWQEAWAGLRGQNEGGNGNLKKSALDSIDNPRFHLPHGRVAQACPVFAGERYSTRSATAPTPHRADHTTRRLQERRKTGESYDSTGNS